MKFVRCGLTVFCLSFMFVQTKAQEAAQCREMCSIRQANKALFSYAEEKGISVHDASIREADPLFWNEAGSCRSSGVYITSVEANGQDSEVYSIELQEQKSNDMPDCKVTSFEKVFAPSAEPTSPFPFF